MTEYIEREAVNALIEAECSPKVAAFLNHAIDNIPAADVRPVVLCKDCLHEDCAMYHGPNWFCANGEKREEN